MQLKEHMAQQPGKDNLTWGEYIKKQCSEQKHDLDIIPNCLIKQRIAWQISSITTISHLGIEEEYMVIDPETRELKSHEQRLCRGQKIIKDKVKAEMHQAVVEVGTDICKDIDEALKDVSILRKTISADRRRAWVLRWAHRAHIPSVIGKAS